MHPSLKTLIVLAALGAAACGSPRAGAGGGGAARGWLHWRGPHQNGTSTETGLADVWEPGGKNHLWDVALAGRGTPVVAGDRLYALAYRGEGGDLEELLVCLEAATGRPLWEAAFSDFLSDVVYDRYAIGSPAVDAETGNVYVLTSPGIFACFSADGRRLWSHSMMELFGRLTFPNGRTGSPLVDGERVIVRGVTSNWGAQGAAMDRFYAFDKRTGELIWACSPGERPQDNSFALPLLVDHQGRRLFYTGEGSGNVVGVDARTGEPLWRYRIGTGGVNASAVLDGDRVITIHDSENIDSSEIGRMVAVRAGAEPKPGSTEPAVLDRSAEAWRNPLACFTSSPVLAAGRLYQVTKNGELCAVNPADGRVLWTRKLAPDQLHASPLWADGKLYVPMQNGSFYILRPTDAGAEVLCKVALAGNALGAPSVWRGRIYVLTTERLYCFGKEGPAPPPEPPAAAVPPGPAVALQVVPSEVLLRPGQKARFRLRALDATGRVVSTHDGKEASWAKYIPPTARVRSELNAAFNADGELVVPAGAAPSAGAFQATLGALQGTMRGRVIADLPLKEDFESFAIAVAHETEAGAKFAYPPLPWIGARFRWEVREVDGTKALAKTLDNPLFQRAMTFIGHPEMRRYTVEADVMSDGNRRTMSTVGLINQRYLVALVGNAQELEVSSNHERLKVATRFAWAPKVWYHLKTRVDAAPDGSGVVRAKAWKRGDPEPAAWTLEVPHRRAHETGSPGVFGFSPQSQFRVYVDNIVVTPHE
jgi:outer membrane protein assembly factor BamB